MAAFNTWRNTVMSVFRANDVCDEMLSCNCFKNFY